ncbi:hypothetical protein Lche_2953 [Legionella cherrii]|uniref:Uncharacterized protein n=1 Tax=Legionella cherrii TaxID=28084 RepID=A0A0W0SDH7_9GAMM|nr:hypothetical protein [Legionella cherrii]KTC80933.1 hypothetical protein Lche_2953 [Legionella cherrii]
MLSAEQIDARKKYVNLLIQKAKNKALSTGPDNLLYDPQGRVLIDVELSEEEQASFKEGFTGDKNFKPTKVTTVSLDVTKDPDLQELKAKYMDNYGLSGGDLEQLSKVRSSIIPLQQEYHFHLALASRTYAKVLWAKFGNESALRQQHKEQLRKALGNMGGEFDITALRQKLNEEYKQAIQNEEKRTGKPFEPKEEKEFQEKFLSQDNKTYQAILEKLNKKKEFIKTFNEPLEKQIAEDKAKLEAQLALAHQRAMTRVQPLIETAFQKAFSESKNEAKLIKALDKARASISAEAHSILMEEVVRATGRRLSRKDLEKKEVVHLAESTTASPNDLLHTDGSSKLATWISGSQNTAHERGIDTLADRQIATVALEENGYTPSRLQIRTPSLDVKKGIKKKDAINDVSSKLASLATKYAIDEAVTEKPGIGKAFTYNLHTAINDWLGDTGGNNQSAGARIILSGAHLYNKAQLNKKIEEQRVVSEEEIPAKPENVAPKPYCLVQNISVNGFGDSLGYGGNDLTTEATLMAEMAMLYNLVGENDAAKQKVQEVFEQYNKFLDQADAYPEDDLFFSKSDEGKAAIALIGKIKEAWQVREEEVVNNNPVERAKAALKTMMANDLHHQHEYSKLIQSLSIFIEEASIAGCKSGNERAQAINGRVAILDHEAAKANKGEPKDHFFRTIDALAQATNVDQVFEQADSLKQKLDMKYDKRLQSGVSLISDVDQGASAKVNAPKIVNWKKHPFDAIKAFFSNISRNIAEESSLQYLSQGKAGNMQAHKGLTEFMADSWGAKGFKKFLGGWGAFAHVITLGLAFLVSLPLYAYSSYQSNKEINGRIERAMLDDKSEPARKEQAVNPEIKESYADMKEWMPPGEGVGLSESPGKRVEQGTDHDNGFGVPPPPNEEGPIVTADPPKSAILQ